jgi:uncharacterized protein
MQACGPFDRRTLLRGVLGAAGAAALALPFATACASTFAGVRLRIATASQQGEYYKLGKDLAPTWQQHLGLDVAPEVQVTAGSVDNLNRLDAATADVAFAQVDATVDQLDRVPAGSPGAPSALGRVYDEFVHVVVPAGSPARALSELRATPISVGAKDSGVEFVAKRLLKSADVASDGPLIRYLGIGDSITALRRGEIGAFFWTGGIPTTTIADLSTTFPIRLLDLADIIKQVRQDFPVYTPGTVPAGTYGKDTEATTTLLVRNALVVANRMPDDLAYALTETVFTTQDEVASTNPLAASIDLRAAIGIQPVPMHPGALAYFRHAKSS